MNFGRNLDISQTLLICAGYIDMNYDASRLSQNLKYDIQSTKNFQSPKVSKLQSICGEAEKMGAVEISLSETATGDP